MTYSRERSATGTRVWRVSPAVSGVLAAAGAALAVGGVCLMSNVNAYTGTLALPAWLGGVFGNAAWVEAGTLTALVGLALAAWTLVEPAMGVGELAWSERRLPLCLWAPVACLALTGWLLALGSAWGHVGGIAGWLELAVAACGLVLVLATVDGRVGRPRLGLCWWERLLLAGAASSFVLAMVWDMRSWLYSFLGDEWSFYGAARGLVDGGRPDLFGQAGVYGIHPWADSAYTALVMVVAGSSVVGWKLAGVLAVVAAVPPIYLLGRGLGGRLVGAGALVMYLSCHLLWAFCHIGYNNNDLLLVVPAAGTALYMGLRRDSVVWLAVAGLAAGLAWYGIFTGRLMILVLVLTLASERAANVRCWLLRLGALLAGFALVTLPLLLDNGAATLEGMVPLVGVSGVRTSDDRLTLLAGNSVRALYAFFYGSENSHYVQGGIFDALSAAGLLFGLALALRHPWRLENRLLLCWLGVGVGLTTPLYYVAQVADTRMQIVIPPAAILAASGWVAIGRSVSELAPRAARLASLIVLLVVVGCSIIVLNSVAFYRVMPARTVVTGLALGMGGILTIPQGPVVVAGQLDDNNLCWPLAGYGVAAGRVLAARQSGLTPLCPALDGSAVTRTPARGGTVVMLGADAWAWHRCQMTLHVRLKAPDGSDAVWIAPLPGPLAAGRLPRSLRCLLPNSMKARR